MALYGMQLDTEEGTRFLVIRAYSARNAMDLANQAELEYKTLQITPLEDILCDQYGGMAELTTL